MTPACIFPLLLPTDLQCRSYAGFLTLPSAGRLATALFVRLHDIPPAGSSFSGASIELSEELASFLTNHEGEVIKRLKESTSLFDFLVEFKVLLERLLTLRRPIEAVPAAFYSDLIKEIGTLGWSTILDAGDKLDWIHIGFTDAAGRKHAVSVSLPPTYPKDPPKITVCLPHPITLAWPASGGSLTTVRTAIMEALDRYQDLWDCLDDMDRHAWVVDPQKPERKDCYRRILLGGHCSVEAILDPARPRAPPELYFMGPEGPVAALRAAVQTRRDEWDESRLPRKNLEAQLDMTLPSRTTSVMEDTSADCCICYGYHLGGATPDLHCGNARCGRPFHRACLAEWLQSIGDSRHSFGTVFGECPYCTAPIFVQIYT